MNQLLVSYQKTNSVRSSSTKQRRRSITSTSQLAANANQNSAGIIKVGGPGPGVGVDQPAKGWTLQDDLTFTNLHLAGDHTLKFGCQLRHDRPDDTERQLRPG